MHALHNPFSKDRCRTVLLTAPHSQIFRKPTLPTVFALPDDCVHTPLLEIVYTATHQEKA